MGAGMVMDEAEPEEHVMTISSRDEKSDQVDQ